jgi:hypothetical protein
MLPQRLQDRASAAEAPQAIDAATDAIADALQLYDGGGLEFDRVDGDAVTPPQALQQFAQVRGVGTITPTFGGHLRQGRWAERQRS